MQAVRRGDMVAALRRHPDLGMWLSGNPPWLNTAASAGLLCSEVSVTSHDWKLPTGQTPFPWFGLAEAAIATIPQFKFCSSVLLPVFSHQYYSWECCLINPWTQISESQVCLPEEHSLPYDSRRLGSQIYGWQTDQSTIWDSGLLWQCGQHHQDR